MNHPNGWTDEISRKLVHLAAKRAPEALSLRLEEEWLADLADRPRGNSQLRFAAGCCWATFVIAYQHRPASLPLASAGLGTFNLSQVSRRSITLFLVVTLHAALFYMLMTKLSQTHFKPAPPPFAVETLKEPPPEPVLPTTPEPIFKHDAIEVDEPQIPPFDGGDEGSDVIVTEQHEPGIPMPPLIPTTPPVHVVQRISGGPGAGFPNVDHFYPDAAKRLGEQGSAIVQVCVDPKGRLNADPIIAQSTGSARLDEGALKLTRAASGHYRATSEDGQLVNSCYAIKIHFQLKE